MAPYIVMYLGFTGFVLVSVWQYNKQKVEQQQAEFRNKCTAQVIGTVRGNHIVKGPYNSTHSSSSYRGYRTGQRTGQRTDFYYPIFMYSVRSVEYIWQSTIGTPNVPKYAAGQSVTVFYDPSDPKRYYVLGEESPIKPPISIIAVAVIFALIGIAVMLWGAILNANRLTG